MGDASPGPASTSASTALRNHAASSAIESDEDEELARSVDNALLADDPLEEGNGKLPYASAFS